MITYLLILHLAHPHSVDAHQLDVFARYTNYPACDAQAQRLIKYLPGYYDWYMCQLEEPPS